MSYEIAPMILFSQDRTRMLNFLSDVFEFEVDPDEFLVFNQGLIFRLENVHEEISDNQIDHQSSVAFKFYLKEESEIEEILNKYNFFQYRRGQSLKVETFAVIDSVISKTLKIIDIDQRPWCFEYKKAH